MRKLRLPTGWLHHPRPTLRWLPWLDYAPIFLVVLLSASATLAIYTEVTRLERQRVETAFSSAARDRVLVIQREIENSLNVVQDIESFFSASDRVTRREFREFVQPVLKRDPSVSSLAWVPIVESEERESFLFSARESFPRFDIYAATPDDQPPEQGAMHFPLLYVQPYQSGVTPLGLDLTTIPAESAMLNQAAETGRTQVLAGPSQLWSASGSAEFAVYAPVYWLPPQHDDEDQPPVPAERGPETLRGFVIGRFVIEGVVRRALANLSPSGIDMRLTSPAKDDVPQLFHEHRSRIRPQGGSGEFRQGINTLIQEHQDILEFADDRWEIVCTAVPGRFQPEALAGRVVLVGGGAFTLLFAVYLFSLVGRAKQIRLLVAQRTLQLEAANKALSCQVSERFRAEHALQRLNLTLEERVARRTAEAERRAAELEQFAYVASHDLKAPLRAIANLAEWLAEDLADRLTPDTSEQLKLLRDRVARMHLLIEGLLSYSRVGRTKESFTEVDCADLIAETLDSLAPPPGFTFEVAEGMPKLVTDRLQLGQAFANLIGNSVKHHHRDEGKIRIGGQDLGAFCEFTIADDGPGIPAEYHDKVFKMFQTLKTKDYEGDSGIGLALTKKIVEEHGGSILLTSTEGKGSTFRFTWYKAEAGKAARATESEFHTKAGPAARVRAARLAAERSKNEAIR